ncbi:MAG: peptidyl-tRNA hydrolase, partial [Deltaproteobacteria bacterium]|nr:peptidyl-tRNA hydrolase [Deltaproteobacteria bacterium]
MYLVLGLGNPGRRYEKTRHNAGFLVADRLAGRWSTAFGGKQFNTLLGKTRIHDRPVILAKPQTFMNLSGQAAASLRGYYKVPDEQVVVVHDDVDIPFGQVRVKRGGGH